MIDILGGMVGGLGLFCVGMWFLTENLKTLASRRIRMLAARWTGNPRTAFVLGTLLGGTTQNLSALTFIVVGMTQSGLLSVRRALPVILGGSFGTTLLVLVVTFDIELAALYVLGIASVLMLSERASRYRPLAAALFGMGTLVFGLVLLKESAAPLAGQPWFGDVMQWSRDSLVFSLLGAALLTFIVQSSSAVCIFGITIASVGLLTVDQAIIFIYGSFLGSGLIQYVLSAKLSGSSRQIAMYMVLYNVISCAAMVLLLYVELYFDVPFMKAWVLSFDLHPSQQLALVTIFCDPLWLPVTMSTLGPCERFLERQWPRTELEDQSSTKFIHDHSFGDVQTSLVLVDLEQRRLLGMFSGYFNAVREEASLDPLREATRGVLARVKEFLDELEARYSNQDAEDINLKLTRQKLLSWLEVQLAELCEGLQGTAEYPALGNLRTSLVEGVDAVILIMCHSLESRHEDLRPTVRQLTDDRSAMMRRVRDSYLDATPSLGDAERANVYKLMSLTDQTFYLLLKLAYEFHDSPDLPGESAR